MDKPAPKRKRTRKSDGQFKPDDGVNNAWEPTEMIEAVSEKTVKYKVTQKVSGTSNSSAGKYTQASKVRPTFGNVTTTTF